MLDGRVICVAHVIPSHYHTFLPPSHHPPNTPPCRQLPHHSPHTHTTPHTTYTTPCRQLILVVDCDASRAFHRLTTAFERTPGELQVRQMAESQGTLSIWQTIFLPSYAKFRPWEEGSRLFPTCNSAATIPHSACRCSQDPSHPSACCPHPIGHQH